MKHYPLIITFILLFAEQIYSQSQIKLGTFASANKLEYIILMKNNTFGFISYEKESPYLADKKPKRNINPGDCGIKGFLVNQTGSGKYIIENDSLKLTFIQRKSMVDSIKVRLLRTTKFKNPVNVTFIAHYNYKALGITELEVRDLQNRTIAGIYENNLSPNIGIARFPLTLIVNEEKELLLNYAQNQEVDIYINSFNAYNITSNTKQYSIKSLTEILEE